MRVGSQGLEASNMSYLQPFKCDLYSLLYQPIKSTIHLFGEVEANALYLKKIKDKTKNKLKKH